MSEEKVLTLRGKKAVWAPGGGSGPIDPKRLPEGYPYKEGVTIEWDGNTDGRVVVARQCYKVSGTVFDNLVGCKVAYYIQAPDAPGEQREAVVNGYSMDGGVYFYSVNVAEMGDSLPIIAVVPEGHSTYEAGTYFCNMAGGALYVTALVAETIHPMSEEFLPALTSPNGTKYKLTVADDGTLSAVAAE